MWTRHITIPKPEPWGTTPSETPANNPKSKWQTAKGKVSETLDVKEIPTGAVLCDCLKIPTVGSIIMHPYTSGLIVYEPSGINHFTVKKN